MSSVLIFELNFKRNSRYPVIENTIAVDKKSKNDREKELGYLKKWTRAWTMRFSLKTKNLSNVGSISDSIIYWKFSVFSFWRYVLTSHGCTWCFVFSDTPKKRGLTQKTILIINKSLRIAAIFIERITTNVKWWEILSSLCLLVSSSFLVIEWNNYIL